MDKTAMSTAIAGMREMARDAKKHKEMLTAWSTVCDQLEAYYLTMRPLPRSFEVRQINEHARARFAHAMTTGKPMAECIEIAVASVVR